MNLDLDQLKHTKAALLAEIAKIDTLIKAVPKISAHESLCTGTAKLVI